MTHDELGRKPHAGKGAKRSPVFWIVLATLVLVLLWTGGLGGFSAKPMPYSQFKAHLAAGEVERVVIAQGEIRGSLWVRPEARGAPAGGEDGGQETGGERQAQSIAFRTVRLEDPDLIEQLQGARVEYSGVRPSPFGSLLLTWVLPLVLVLVVLGWIFRSATGRAGTQALGFGKSRAKLVPEEGTGVTFEDVAGCDEAKADLHEMVEFLRNPQRFTSLGARIPRGVLLLGPPGTGKTLLARAVAGEAEVPFLSISGSDFVEMFVGVGAARVRDLFVKAKQRAPCIVFVDEIDAVGRQRGVTMGVVNDEREQTLNQLLSEMDGFEVNSGVILLAATNRPEILDRALLRPGRFDRQVVLDAPDRRGREAILRVHARGKPMGPDVDLSEVARTTPGMSGADLANALNEAALGAAQRGAGAITQLDVEQAVERVMAGPERRSRRLGEEEKRRVAFHEAGHALVAASCEHADPVEKISIVPRGHAALGYTLQLPEQEQFLATAPELRERLTVLMGGRAAEEIVLGETSTGAQDDLQTATALARQMVCRFGMSDRVGLPVCARPAQGPYAGEAQGGMLRDCSEETAREIDQEVRRLLDEAYGAAKEALVEDRVVLEAVAKELLERETLGREEFEKLIEKGGGWKVVS